MDTDIGVVVILVIIFEWWAFCYQWHHGSLDLHATSWKLEQFEYSFITVFISVGVNTELNSPNLVQIRTHYTSQQEKGKFKPSIKLFTVGWKNILDNGKAAPQ